MLTEKGLFASRNRAQGAIMAGTVKVDDYVVRSPSRMVDSESKIDLVERMPYVSRGGLKLERSLDSFKIELSGRSAIDIGASTGGFTDCLLKRGISKIIAVDVGYGQFDWELRNDSRVTLFERTNIKNLTPDRLPFVPDLVTVDLSFISTAKVLEFIIPLLAEKFDMLILLKPQFEGERGMVQKGGVVRDPANQVKIIERFLEKSSSLGLATVDLIFSIPKGKEGNIEFFVWLAESGRRSRIQEDIYNKIVDTVERSHATLDEKS